MKMCSFKHCLGDNTNLFQIMLVCAVYKLQFKCNFKIVILNFSGILIVPYL